MSIDKGSQDAEFILPWSSHAAACLCCLLVAGTLPACSDDSKTSDGTLDDNQKLSTLTDAQIGALCDWSNAKQGGYGNETKCSDGSTVSAQKDQAACKAEDGPTLMKCDQTVAVYKACTIKIAANECDIGPAVAHWLKDTRSQVQPLLRSWLVLHVCTPPLYSRASPRSERPS